VDMTNWAQILKSSNQDILNWAAEQPWAHAMHQCMQDKEWHAEGDVWTHTKMVYAETEMLKGFSELTREDQLKLLFTALLHDIGKPATTRVDPDTGRTRSPKHSHIGASMARIVLRDLACDLPMRESIVNLIRYHGRPPYLLENESPELAVIKLSPLLSNRLLYYFVLADSRGRITTDLTRHEDTLDLWRDLALEHDCYEKAFAFANDQARLLLFRDELSSLHYVPHAEYKCSVTLMSGLPGSGKDTWLAKNKPEMPVVSLDGIREELDVTATDNQGQVVQSARERCREHLRAKRDFAFNATNLTQQMRKRWIDLFIDYGARVEIVYIEPPLSTILKQNKERENNVPERVIHRLLEKLEVPTLAEAHAVTIVG